jgi:tryptophan halogenase
MGAGSAGLFAALTLKRKHPQLAVRIVRSKEVGIIGVGESTQPTLQRHVFDYLGISRRYFYEHAEPTWKMAIRFLWGPRGCFYYPFDTQLDVQHRELARPHGFYCEEDFSAANLTSALMEQGKAFARQPGGAGPQIIPAHAFHVENRHLVETLERIGREWGIAFTEGKVARVERGPAGVAALHCEDGQRLAADLFIDASGFRSELLGRTLEEPFISYAGSLFCDRAVTERWPRTDEPILPFTTAETMDAGWCWQIEHEHYVDRGYVFSSSAISDDEAAAEFRRKNPKAPEPRLVKFRSGRYRRLWVDNVVAIGNAGGFVEPLEATALGMVCTQSRVLAEILRHGSLAPGDTLRRLYNDLVGRDWDEIRDFLSLHYRFNTRLDTPFWQRCRAEVDVTRMEPLLEFYRENGPTGLCRHLLPSGTESIFSLEGYLVILTGNRVPYRARHTPSETERAAWARYRAQLRAEAATGMDVREALACIRHPGWRWSGEA